MLPPLHRGEDIYLVSSCLVINMHMQQKQITTKSLGLTIIHMSHSFYTQCSSQIHLGNYLADFLHVWLPDVLFPQAKILKYLFVEKRINLLGSQANHKW